MHITYRDEKQYKCAVIEFNFENKSTSRILRELGDVCDSLVRNKQRVRLLEITVTGIVKMSDMLLEGLINSIVQVRTLLDVVVMKLVLKNAQLTDSHLIDLITKVLKPQAEYLRSGGSGMMFPREVHLSHNLITHVGATRLLLFALDHYSNTTPLWIRLDWCPIASNDIPSHLKAGTCNPKSISKCNPHHCDRPQKAFAHVAFLETLCRSSYNTSTYDKGGPSNYGESSSYKGYPNDNYNRNSNRRIFTKDECYGLPRATATFNQSDVDSQLDQLIQVSKLDVIYLTIRLSNVELNENQMTTLMKRLSSLRSEDIIIDELYLDGNCFFNDYHLTELVSGVLLPQMESDKDDVFPRVIDISKTSVTDAGVRKLFELGIRFFPVGGSSVPIVIILNYCNVSDSLMSEFNSKICPRDSTMGCTNGNCYKNNSGGKAEISIHAVSNSEQKSHQTTISSGKNLIGGKNMNREMSTGKGSKNQYITSQPIPYSVAGKSEPSFKGSKGPLLKGNRGMSAEIVSESAPFNLVPGCTSYKGIVTIKNTEKFDCNQIPDIKPDDDYTLLLCDDAVTSAFVEKFKQFITSTSKKCTSIKFEKKVNDDVIESIIHNWIEPIGNSLKRIYLDKCSISPSAYSKLCNGLPSEVDVNFNKQFTLETQDISLIVDSKPNRHWSFQCINYFRKFIEEQPKKICIVVQEVSYIAEIIKTIITIEEIPSTHVLLLIPYQVFSNKALKLQWNYLKSTNLFVALQQAGNSFSETLLSEVKEYPIVFTTTDNVDEVTYPTISLNHVLSFLEDSSVDKLQQQVVNPLGRSTSTPSLLTSTNQVTVEDAVCSVAEVQRNSESEHKPVGVPDTEVRSDDKDASEVQQNHVAVSNSTSVATNEVIRDKTSVPVTSNVDSVVVPAGQQAQLTPNDVTVNAAEVVVSPRESEVQLNSKSEDVVGQESEIEQEYVVVSNPTSNEVIISETSIPVLQGEQASETRLTPSDVTVLTRVVDVAEVAVTASACEVGISENKTDSVPDVEVIGSSDKAEIVQSNVPPSVSSVAIPTAEQEPEVQQNDVAVSNPPTVTTGPSDIPPATCSTKSPDDNTATPFWTK